MSQIGQINPFDESIEDFDTYCSRVEFYFLANKIKDDQKKAVFVTLLGSRLFSLLQNLVAPKTLQEATYDEVVQAMKDHFKPKVIIIYERFKFHTRNQNPHESVADFVAGLKSCARTCDFGDSLDDSLRDRFVVGLNDEATQRTLLTEPDLTFQKAVHIATARETAAKDVREMGRKSSTSVLAVHSSKSLVTQKALGSGSSSSDLPKFPCSGCGQKHWRRDCPWRDKECFRCGKKGHLRKCCKNLPKMSNSSSPKQKKYYRNKKSETTGRVTELTDSDSRVASATHSRPVSSSADYDSFIFKVMSETVSPAPITREVYVNDVPLTMELDTGAARSLLSYSMYMSMPSTSRPKLLNSGVRLHAYGGSPLKIRGEINVQVAVSPSATSKQATIIVVDSAGPALMGRDMLALLDFAEFSINSNDVTSPFVDAFPSLFEPGLGCFTDAEVSLSVDPAVTPKFCKARTVPYALRDKVESEISRLESEGIVSPVPFSKWAAAIVPVVKPNGSIRICGDYKLTVNRALAQDTYPIPRLEDLLSSLSNAKLFTRIDMSQAYAQLRLDETSKVYTTINTTKGLYQYNRLPFGVSSAPGVFQRTMEGILSDLPGVSCYLDDVLIYGATKQEHDSRVTAVLNRLQTKGLKVQPHKCCFGVKEIFYLGYIISDAGIKADPAKVQAVADAPRPTSVKQLQAFLGSIGFYRRFLPKFSTIIEPLNLLLRAETKWFWGLAQEHAFQQAKQLLLKSEALVLFNPEQPLVVVADSSAYGIGAVLCHKVGKIERPICFASRTLTSAERNYSQLEKEALAMVFAVKKFHNYLWGQCFTFVTDHRPLLGIFSPTRAIPPMASGRIQRWALLLQTYRFHLVHRSGALLGTADALSRLPLPTFDDVVPVLGEWTNLVHFLEETPVTAATIATHTRSDPVLSKVLRFCELGWPPSSASLGPEFSPFYSRRDELGGEGGCVLWGSRVIVPSKLQSILVKELHSGHIGASRMKELARSYFWWPGLDQDLETLVRSCSHCLENRPMPPKADIHPWEWPRQPWHRLHIDYAGPIKSKFFLIVVDSHSKWVEIFVTRGPSASETVRCLRHCFSHFGLPVSVVSDNGSCFVSSEFQDFMRQNGIKHYTSSVYKPSTNGLAERMVRTFKDALATTTDSLEVFLDKFLFKYRLTPHATTGLSPSELLLKRRIRCRLDLLFPADRLESRVTRAQDRQRESRRSGRSLNLSEGDPVMVRNYASGPSWLPAQIQHRTGPVSYQCRLPEGHLVKRHQDQLYPAKTLPIVPTDAALIPSPVVGVPSVSGNKPADPPFQVPSESVQPEITPPPVETQVFRRSTRMRHPVDRLNL